MDVNTGIALNGVAPLKEAREVIIMIMQSLKSNSKKKNFDKASYPGAKFIQFSFIL